MFFNIQNKASELGINLVSQRTNTGSGLLQCLPITSDSLNYYMGSKNAVKNAEKQAVDAFGEQPEVACRSQKTLTIMLAMNYDITDQTIVAANKLYSSTGAAPREIVGVRARQRGTLAVAEWVKDAKKRIPTEDQTPIEKPVVLGQAANASEVFCSPDLELLWRFMQAEAVTIPKQQIAMDAWYALRIGGDEAAIKQALNAYQPQGKQANTQGKPPVVELEQGKPPVVEQGKKGGKQPLNR